MADRKKQPHNFNKKRRKTFAAKIDVLTNPRTLKPIKDTEKVCPKCGSQIILGQKEKTWYCTNATCPHKKHIPWRKAT